MASLLLAVIYLVFISLGLPDSLLGAGWPAMQGFFGVPSSAAGYVAMTISLMTILSALICPALSRRIHPKWIVTLSVALTAAGLLGFSFAGEFYLLFLFAVPYGLGAGAIDTVINEYVAAHYSGAVMNFLHCFYGLGAAVSPFIMGQALRTARWNEGYRWTAYLQLFILAVCLFSLPLWDKSGSKADAPEDAAGLKEALKRPGVPLTLLAFFAYCTGEATAGLWTASYFAGRFPDMDEGAVAFLGSLIFGGLMAGRVLSGILSVRWSDKRLIRAGIVLEILGVLLILLPVSSPVSAVAGFLAVGTGMAPVYPAVVHMAPHTFGKRFSSAVIGLEMASAYVGYTLMPSVFGELQQAAGIAILPFYLLLFALITLTALECSYRKQAR